MRIQISSDNGYIDLGALRLAWGNALITDGLPGYFGIDFIFSPYRIEFGDIDQGQPGIYITRFDDGEPSHVKTLWTA